MQKDVASAFKVHRVTLLRWKKAEAAIKRAPPAKKFVKKEKRRGRQVLYPELEDLEVYVSVKASPAASKFSLTGYALLIPTGVTTHCLLLMAARLQPRLVADRSERAALEYLLRFRARNKLSIRRITHRGTEQRAELEV